MERYFDDCMTLEELRRRYKEWVVKLHPDRNPGDPDAEQRFKAMQTQYEERMAELKGDYSHRRRHREERRESERERERRAAEEARERARQRVERVREAARLNRQKEHTAYRVGDYLYGCSVGVDASLWQQHLDDVLDDFMHHTPETAIVTVEHIVDVTDEELLTSDFRNFIPEGVWGGWEVLNAETGDHGRRRVTRAAKVIAIRSPHYCVMGNAKGDQVFSTFYLLDGRWETMFAERLYALRAKAEMERQRKEREARERWTRLEAEQAPMMERWAEELIELSACLSSEEQQTVARDNLRYVLAHTFPGVRFTVRPKRTTTNLSTVKVSWEDGPTLADVQPIIDTFNLYGHPLKGTPWSNRFGGFYGAELERKMGTLTKARILQQLGQVSVAFRHREQDEEVTLTDFDWVLLHAMVGVDVASGTSDRASNIRRNGAHVVTPKQAVRFIFDHTNYTKPKTQRKTKKQ